MQTDVFTRNPVLHGYWYAVAQLSDVAPGPLSVTVLDNPLSQTPQLLEANAFTMLKQAIEVRRQASSGTAMTRYGMTCLPSRERATG